MHNFPKYPPKMPHIIPAPPLKHHHKAAAAPQDHLRAAWKQAIDRSHIPLLIY